MRSERAIHGPIKFIVVLGVVWYVGIVAMDNIGMALVVALGAAILAGALLLWMAFAEAEREVTNHR